MKQIALTTLILAIPMALTSIAAPHQDAPHQDAPRARDAHPPVREAVKDRLDRNDDGAVGRRERQLAEHRREQVRDHRGEALHRQDALQRRDAHQGRADRDRGGRLGPRERAAAVRKARRVRGRADRNDDGRVGPLERAAVRKQRGEKQADCGGEGACGERPRGEQRAGSGRGPGPGERGPQSARRRGPRQA